MIGHSRIQCFTCGVYCGLFGSFNFESSIILLIFKCDNLEGMIMKITKFLSQTSRPTYNVQIQFAFNSFTCIQVLMFVGPALLLAMRGSDCCESFRW